MSMTREQRITALLGAIEQEMQNVGLWQTQPPSADALASTQPFCVDTLLFTEWVQWLMLPRLQQMLQSQTPLPQNSNMHAMAEEAFKQLTADTKQLLELIKALDNALTVKH